MVDHGSPRLNAALGLWRHGRQSDATALFEDAMRQEPENVQSYIVAARAYGERFQFDGMDEAIAKAAELARLGDERGVRYLERPRSWEEQLLDMFASEDSEAPPTDALATLAPAPEPMLRLALAELGAILGGPSIQARCLECPVQLRALSPKDERGLLALVGGWGGGTA